MKKQYLDHSTVEKIMGHLAEEMGEVLTANSKVERFGMDSYHPDDPSRERNRVRVLKELMDLRYVACVAIAKIAEGLNEHGFTPDEMQEIENYEKYTRPQYIDNVYQGIYDSMPRQLVWTDEVLAQALDALADRCHSASKAGGWWEVAGVDMATIPEDHPFAPFAPYVYATKMVLEVGETVEKMEAFRRDQMDDHLPDIRGEEAEGVDQLIRNFDLAGARGHKVGAVWLRKMQYNSVRADHKPENRVKVGGKKF